MYSRVIVRTAAVMLSALTLIAAATTVRVPFQTRLKVFLKDAVSSAQAQPGDRVHLVVAEDVVVGGYIVFAKGADGLATVDKVSPGVVHVVFNWVHAVDGTKIGVTGEHTNADGSSSTAGGGIEAGDVSDTLNRANNVAYSAGAPGQVQDVVSRANSTFGQVFGGRKPSATPSPSPAVPIDLFVKNPNGVPVVATQTSDDDDTGVK